MDTNEIIALIDHEIATLQQAREVLTEGSTKKKPGRPKGSTGKKKRNHKLSPEGRARIVAAMKKRWAASKKAK